MIPCFAFIITCTCGTHTCSGKAQVLNDLFLEAEKQSENPLNELRMKTLTKKVLIVSVSVT